VFTDAVVKNYDIVILPGGINGSKAFASVSLYGLLADFAMMYG